MKKYNFLTMLLSVAVVVSLIVVSACTKEGPQGPPGQDGEDGIDGKDGNATCGVCHDNTETVSVRILQWSHSIHAIGGNYERNAPGCAPCHTSQGFKEVVETGETSTAAAISNPSNINCYTCHMIHDTYTQDDWDLRTSEPVTMWLTGNTFDFGKGNLCLNCHQPRNSYAIPDVNTPDLDYTVTSSRFGPHHGSQGSLLAGDALYMVGSGYGNNGHAGIDNACVTCHMAEAFGSQAGGHQFGVAYDYHGSTELNVAGCLECHTEEEAITATEALQEEVHMLLEELAALLEAEGIYNPATGLANSGTYSTKVAGAYWNFISLEEDRSFGVHNPKMVVKILENTIASLQ